MLGILLWFYLREIREVYFVVLGSKMEALILIRLHFISHSSCRTRLWTLDPQGPS